MKISHFEISSNYHIVHQIEAVVDKILESKQVRAYRNTPQPGTSKCEREIDRLVYSLYELTEEEIRIIEGAG